LQKRRASKSRSRLLIWAVPSAIAVLVASWFTLLGSSAANPTPPPALGPAYPSRQLFPLEIDPNPVSLGILEVGQSGERLVSLRNPQSELVYLERISTSCPCIQVTPAPIQVSPRETKNLTVRFDLSTEPDFRGGLSVEITGIGVGEQVLFQSKVDFEVRAALIETTDLQNTDPAPRIQETPR
jgi:hypothetical protein